MLARETAVNYESTEGSMAKGGSHQFCNDTAGLSSEFVQVRIPEFGERLPAEPFLVDE